MRPRSDGAASTAYDTPAAGLFARRGVSARLLLAAMAGAAGLFAYAPFDVFPAAFISLGALALLLTRETRARGGWWIGFAWGLGAFLAGVSWLYVALNRYGGVPAPLAALAITLLCAYMALFPAMVAAAFVRLRHGGSVRGALLFGGLWVLGEVLRGLLLTGFPWLSVGYSQTPPSPLAGYLPVVGVYGVGGLVAAVAALLALVRWRAAAALRLPLGLVLGVVVGGVALGRVAWTAPHGAPLKVALAQTNIEQGLKWRPELLADWLDVNERIADVEHADVVVLPETALPLLFERLPADYVANLAQRARARNADLILGVFERDQAGRIYNAAISIGAAPTQRYAKQHLVPFGEYSPPLFGWFYKMANIPMSDQTSGGANQPPLALGGQKIAVNICYEDLFGRELIRSLPEATLMLNMSNLAWYGQSLAQPQHLQIARVRALETGRPMLRATNTGMTALVQPDGQVAAVLPQFERGVLRVDVQGYQGMTPYARWGDWAAIVLAVLSIVLAIRWRRRQ
ncbi:MAG: apolipoprotein N-acyltransferase [Rhodocyclales bacterium]|nr:apolipoprotein N-acyltransferase [Rhodocyclales bacterium]